ncbi:MAG TPA: Ppx/GppA phosphatase family protein [Candidatus Limnocylindrales bacterium]|nr:Ppx/GppA phosphatase family protein [Candidatus Limnocylindrales bacterium]
MQHSVIAVIDLGSNSARIVVFRATAGGVLDVVADEHVSLRLIRGLDKKGLLRDKAIDGAVRLLSDFRKLADGAGAGRILAFGTAALREAGNKDELLARARKESGIRLLILDGDEEGRAGFLGAVYGLPVEDGIVFDIGGGSAQITHFRGRRQKRTTSLPLGALRLADRFLKSDPPAASEIQKLRLHVRRLLAKEKIGKLADGARVIGTGGTVRNLAKVAAKHWSYPILRLHGYELSFARLRELRALFLSRDSASRGSLPGLNSSRADSIIAGGIVAETILEACGGTRFLVAGYGMREGSVLAAGGGQLPSPEHVRKMAIGAFAARFASCERERAVRRARIVLSLYDQLEPFPDPTWREMLLHAAIVVDAGRSIDFYRMHSHSGEMIRSSGLAGFSHRGIAILSSIVEMADVEGWDPRKCSPPLAADDYDALERAGVLLCLSDAIEQRRPPGLATAARGKTKGSAFVISDPGMTSWDDAYVSRRFRQAFGKDLVFSGSPASAEPAKVSDDAPESAEPSGKRARPSRSKKPAARDKRAKKKK